MFRIYLKSPSIRVDDRVIIGLVHAVEELGHPFSVVFIPSTLGTKQLGQIEIDAGDGVLKRNLNTVFLCPFTYSFLKIALSVGVNHHFPDAVVVLDNGDSVFDEVGWDT